MAYAKMDTTPTISACFNTFENNKYTITSAIAKTAFQRQAVAKPNAAPDSMYRSLCRRKNPSTQKNNSKIDNIATRDMTNQNPLLTTSATATHAVYISASSETHKNITTSALAPANTGMKRQPIGLSPKARIPSSIRCLASGGCS